ncbi:RNI-like protein [Terfezia boudieri ATCC MYA-4762]|uniref:RNI-like protein n=1 Tax=Terfezia boudieri ATCC MYA-4762 TaxID=1051890 RepID=A0A3N4LSR0_9PEZI|nr:RNI-like protein [Terfezia boudieri ATCC MYA-4762]
MSTSNPISGIDGVDLGWMQFHTKDHRNRPQSVSPPASPSARSPSNSTHSCDGIPQASSPQPLPTHHNPSQPHTTASASLTNGTPTPVITSPIRRNSWLSSISSKFASNTHNGEAPASPATEAPLKQHPGFLIATLRKLSSSSVPGRGSFGKNQGNGGRCERVVLNKNHTRDRCQISELDGIRLKKVAFCVDVEVSVPSPLSKNDEHSLKIITSAAPEVQTSEKGVPSDARSRDSNTPEETQNKNTEEKSEIIPRDANSTSKSNGAEGIESTEAASKETRPSVHDSKATNFPATTYNLQPTPSFTGSNQGTFSQLKPDNTAPRPRRRPTTDVARIYKRCCQLREIPMLPLIAKQLANSVGKTSLDSLDISNHPLQICDALVLSDFLALAPVTKLDLENCGLTDEALRVILSGLLAVKQPIPKSSHRVNKEDVLKRTASGGSSESQWSRASQEKDVPRCRGMVEWLSLRNNPKIGRDGWRYISLFLHMSRSLKALDVSMIQLPQVPKRPIPSVVFHPSDATALFCRALSERLAGVGLQELALNRCDISTEQLRGIVEAVHKGGTKRLDLEGNHITDDGLIYLAQWVRDGNCEGLSLSSNDLQEHIDILAASLHEKSPLQALGLANCNLSARSLSTLLPALTVLRNFRLLDLSHNPLLFSTQPDALPILRKYLPQLPMLKKLQLAHTFMTPDHAIALSEILPEIRSLAHFDALDNPMLVPGVTNQDALGLPDAVNREGSLEEGAALYTALLAAVKVSKTIVRMDIDDPGLGSGEVIRGLARKVVAFCLRNMENAELYNDNPSAEPVEHMDTDDEDTYPGDGEKDDLVVGGTGVVKALGVCLGNKPYTNKSPLSPGLEGPTQEGHLGRAYDMSKALLYRARKIKERIQSALQKAAREEVDEIHYRKLLFLDDTLFHVIARFEEEYPDCRLAPSSLTKAPSPTTDPGLLAIPSHGKVPIPQSLSSDISPSNHLTPIGIDIDDNDETRIKTPSISRQPSNSSLHSRRALDAEEGQMHKLAMFMQKQFFEKQMQKLSEAGTSDICTSETSGKEEGEDGHAEPPHIRKIKMLMEGMNGEDIRQKVTEEGGALGLIKKLEGALSRDMDEALKQEQEAIFVSAD